MKYVTKNCRKRSFRSTSSMSITLISDKLNFEDFVIRKVKYVKPPKVKKTSNKKKKSEEE